MRQIKTGDICLLIIKKLPDSEVKDWENMKKRQQTRAPDKTPDNMSELRVNA